MSIWTDMQRRSIGEQLRKEDIYHFYFDFTLQGNGTKLPKRFTVPSNIRVQRVLLIISKCDLNGGLPQPSELISFRTFAWTYKVGERNIDELDVMLGKLLKEFGGLTYTIEEEKDILIERADGFLEELKKRITEHNESTCGSPIWSVDRF